MNLKTAELALLLGLTPRRINQLAEEGVTVRTGHGEFDGPASVRNYIASIANKAKDGEAAYDKEREEARLKKEQADTQENPRRFGKARSGVICHQAVLTGLTPSPARFPRLVLRRPHPCAFPFIIAAFSPFCKGDLQIFQGALPLDPSARLS